jgi:serine/threonine protein kinase
MSKTYVLAEGGMGVIHAVHKDATKVIKQFKTLPDTILEVVLTKYFAESPYIVNMSAFDLTAMTMTAERWPGSFHRDYMYDMNEEEKCLIFRRVLYALSHLYDRGIIHADFKWSNLLYNPTTGECVLCDLGLSSVMKYAQVHRACREYKAKDAVHRNDMFAVCVAMAEMFGGITMDRGEQRTISELRRLITKNTRFQNERIRQGLLLMLPTDDPNDAPTPTTICEYLFGQWSEFDMPEISYYSNSICSEDLLYIKNMIYAACKKYNIKRHHTCSLATIQYLNKNNVRPVDYGRYVAASLYIYGCLFHTPLYSFVTAVNFSGGKRPVMYATLTDLINDNDYINLTLVPSHD